MTYSYSNRVASVKLLGLARLLGIWRASVYKLVFRELLIFTALYVAASAVYRFALRNEHQKKVFEKIVVYCGTFESILPVTFVLGFYVSIIVQRWWQQFMHVPWPDRIMSYILVLIPGSDSHSVMIRRCLMRYLLLAEVLLLMAVSRPVKKRFPNEESLVLQGLMTKSEYEIFMSEKVPHVSSKYWLPTHWCTQLLARARREGRVQDSRSLCTLLDELSKFKECLGTVFSYDWISLPLVYTQVATVAVYAFYFNTILSRQYISYESVRKEFGPEISAKYSVDLYFPVETFMQLFFYLGWLKVAEQMINPFGEDDDDFECNWIIDRNLKVGLYAVTGGEAPEPTRDAWWEAEDPSLMYTEASERFAMTSGWFGSTANIGVPDSCGRLAHVLEEGDASSFGSRGDKQETPRRSPRKATLPQLLLPARVVGHRRRRTRTGHSNDSRACSPDICLSLPASHFCFINGIAQAAASEAAAADQPLLPASELSDELDEQEASKLAEVGENFAWSRSSRSSGLGDSEAADLESENADDAGEGEEADCTHDASCRSASPQASASSPSPLESAVAHEAPDGGVAFEEPERRVAFNPEVERVEYDATQPTQIDVETELSQTE